MLDDLDRYFDDFERSVEDVIKTSINTGQKVFSRPVVAGMAMGVGPEGKPSIQFFGDNLIGPDGFRAPIYEQLVDDAQGTLRLLIELPGVEKEDVQVSALDDKVTLQAERGERRYRVEVRLQREIDAESGTASYKNGLLEISFNIKDKTNKGYRRVTIV
jgi:HSP20 family protein